MSRTRAALRATGWVTVGVVIAGGVAAAATSGGGSSSSGSTPTATTASGVAAPAGRQQRLQRLAKLRGRVLHGQVTVLGKDNKPVTRAEQRGTVDAVSANSITLTSKDGFHQTYVVTPDTRVRIDGQKSSIGNVKPGQTAGVLAKVDGSTQTATAVIERPAK